MPNAIRFTVHGKMLISVYVFELHLIPCALRFTEINLRYALCLPAGRQALCVKLRQPCQQLYLLKI
jgi:hypothetical protein